MGEVVRFISKSERERLRLIQRARAIYDGVFPSTTPTGEDSKQAPAHHAISGPNSCCSDKGVQ